MCLFHNLKDQIQVVYGFKKKTRLFWVILAFGSLNKNLRQVILKKWFRCRR